MIICLICFDEIIEELVLKNNLSLVLEKRKGMHDVTNINNRRKEFIVKKLSSINGDLKVDE